MIRHCPAAIDGFSVATLVVGRVYDIKDSTAAFLIATGCAEPYREDGSEMWRSERPREDSSTR
jgi:hypothetical protein